MTQYICNQILTDPDGFTARCMITYGVEHSHHDYTARESISMGNEVVDGKDIIFDKDGNEIHYHLDTDDLPWLGPLDSDCHVGKGLRAPFNNDNGLKR